MTTMRWTILTTSVALAALAAPAHASVRDFRLPAEPVQPPPERQGPVAPDVPASRRPAPTPAPTATPTAATPSPAVTPPVFVSPVAPPATEPQSQPTRPATRPVGATPSPTAVATAPTPSADGPAADAGLAPPVAGTPASSDIARAPAPAISVEADHGSGSWWPWALAALAGLAAIGAAAWFWLQRKAERPAAVPSIERPRLAPESVAPPAPGPAWGPKSIAAVPKSPPTSAQAQASPTRRPSPALPQPTFTEPLQISLEPLRLSLTLMNATLAYRLQVANGGMVALTGLTIGADMISAHASLSREEQLAGPNPASGSGGGAIQTIERLAVGESRVVEGEFRLPLQQIVPIRQGKAALLLPLARFRLEADGARPVVRTFLVGQPGAAERLQPFRLDLGPRIYPNLAQHAFA